MPDVASVIITDVVNFHITKILRGFAALVKVKDKVKHLQNVTKKAMNVIITSCLSIFSFTGLCGTL